MAFNKGVPMGRRAVSLLAGVAWLATAGCSEQREVSPAAPLSTLTTTVPACDFESLSPLVTSYFRNNEDFKELVPSLISQMEAAGAWTAVARDRGFDVLALVSRTVANGNGGPVADGSALINGLLACMFNDPAELPTVFPEDFTAAIDPAVHGAFEVRGGANEPLSAPVYARPGLPATFSGVAPPQGVTWPTILSGVPAPSRLLVYGKPGSTSDSYDWKVVPRNATFNPAAIVALCVDPQVNSTSMLQEENVGLLTFEDAYFLDPNTCSPVASLGWNPLQFARRLFGVRALWAATALNPGGLGGSTGGIDSEFQPFDLQAPGPGGEVGGVTLSFTVQPSDTRVNQTIAPAVQVLATSNGVPVGGVQISLIAVDNNGATVILSGTLTQTTPNSGVVTFSDLSLNKPGAYRLVASGTVLGRPAITVNPATSKKFNVRPLQ
ncbi:MAG: prealbumin-like fold domain-containing protein [Gemmatimonadetes bacterium]|nr:prealbumin-like fold domain-containing protein [Gemmatimonadota bacterium]